jgi:hypothetical protein
VTNHEGSIEEEQFTMSGISEFPDSSPSSEDQCDESLYPSAKRIHMDPVEATDKTSGHCRDSIIETGSEPGKEMMANIVVERFILTR